MAKSYGKKEIYCSSCNGRVFVIGSTYKGGHVLRCSKCVQGDGQPLYVKNISDSTLHDLMMANRIVGNLQDAGAQQLTFEDQPLSSANSIAPTQQRNPGVANSTAPTQQRNLGVANDLPFTPDTPKTCDFCSSTATGIPVSIGGAGHEIGITNGVLALKSKVSGQFVTGIRINHCPICGKSVVGGK